MIIENDVNLKQYNTLQIPVNAKYFVVVKSHEDINNLINSELWKNKIHCILWWWSNIFFTKDFDWIIVKNEIMWKRIDKLSINSYLVEVWAGENWSDFVEWSCINNMSWIENLISIPGNVWTSPVSNIWAYWVEVSKFIYDVQWIDLKTGKIAIFKNSECEFDYRNSIFKRLLKQDFIITKVRFLLNKFDKNYTPNISYPDIQKYIIDNDKTPKTPTEISEIIKIIRNNKLPNWHKIWTAWSFFSNPIVSKKQLNVLESIDSTIIYHEIQNKTWEIMYKLSAGQLIEKCWLKWWRISNWTTWTFIKHALILINEWWTADDVLESMHIIQNKVKESFWIQLEPEVVLI